MRFVELGLVGVWLIEPELVVDERGVFRRTLCAKEFAEHGLAATAVQGNISENPHDGTLRGFHYQVPPFEEAKTLLCVSGALFDIVVDLRPSSPTFLQWVSLELSAADRRSLHVPAGCANAWLTTQPNTTVHYYMSELYRPNADRGIRYDDPLFGFQWPAKPRMISKKDEGYPNFDPSTLAKN
ncbi:MAG: rfbC [Gemmatimonadetes bacterium]|nr:rfbC [Gemmatimonadota bacterium]